MNAPHGFRKSWLDWFACPNCGYHSAFSYSTAKIGSDRKSLQMLYWCRSCEHYCTLKRQGLLPLCGLGVLLAQVPVFVLVYWLLYDGLLNLNILWSLFWVACILVGVHAAWFFIVRFSREYVAVTNNEP
jgi:membrane protein insertase Oxa1/YidC/SpoIIIJ